MRRDIYMMSILLSMTSQERGYDISWQDAVFHVEWRSSNLQTNDSMKLHYWLQSRVQFSFVLLKFHMQTLQKLDYWVTLAVNLKLVLSIWRYICQRDKTYGSVVPSLLYSWLKNTSECSRRCCCAAQVCSISEARHWVGMASESQCHFRWRDLVVQGSSSWLRGASMVTTLH